MNIRELISKEDEAKLLNKISIEYSLADKHTRNWKQNTKDLASKYLLPFPTGEDKIKVRKVLNNLTVRLATFVSDELQVTNVPMNGVIGNEIAENCNKVFEANFKSMDIKNKYREALIDDAIQGVGVLAVDGWNDHTQEPIVSYIDSRLTFPDPKNWQDNKMSFFGTKLKKNYYELESDDAYDFERIKEAKFETDIDLKEIERANADIKGFTYTFDDDGVSLYNHLTIFKASDDEKPSLYLTTYTGSRNKLVRLVKMRALNEGEQADPSTIDFGVKLFRAKPIKGSYAGVSLIDDVGQYQDIETLLTNLQIEQAKLAAVGGKTFVNSELGIDIDDLANNSGPGDVIPFASANPAINASNGIMLEPTRPVNPITQNTISYVNQLAQLADPSGNSLAQGASQSGTQTKAEVQTLQQNINQVLSYMASNYMDSLRGLWESIYRSYASNMSSQRKKSIVIVDDNNKANNYGFKKNEFITTGDVYVIVKSKTQEDIKKKQDFAILLSVYGSLKQSIAPGTTQANILDRMLIDKSGIRGINSNTLFPLTKDERIAYENLELLNLDIKLKTKPQPGEDHEVYINIYKTGLDTPARNKAISLREIAMDEEPTQAIPQEQTQGGVAQQMGASMLSQQTAQGQTPSIGDVQS